MDRINYVEAVSRLKVLETKLLDKGKLNRMIESTNSEEALKVLGETEYSNYLNNMKTPNDYEFALSEELKKLYEFIYKLSPRKEIVDVLSLKYDYHNIKVLLKGKYLNKNFNYLLIPVGTIELEIIKKCLEDEYYSDLSSNMREAIEEVIKIFENDKDPQKIDIILDKYLYKEMISKALSLGEEYITKFVKIQIDFNNIKTLLRIKKQKKNREFLSEVINAEGYIDREIFINSLNDSFENFVNKISHTDYSKVLKNNMDKIINKDNLNISAIEEIADNFIMDYIKEAKYVSFGPEPILSYVFAKEAEIRSIRTIMVGKINNIAPNIIRERLRDLYV